MEKSEATSIEVERECGFPMTKVLKSKFEVTCEVTIVSSRKCSYGIHVERCCECHGRNKSRGASQEMAL